MFWARPAIILLSFLALALGAATARAEGELAAAIKKREFFFKSKEQMEKRSEWLALIKEFEDAALAQYDPRHASRARYFAAQLAYDSGARFKQKNDFAASAALSKRAVRDCPHCPHAPQAQLVYGQALMAQDQPDQATKELMKVELNYPDSHEVAKARELLAKLRGGPPPRPESAPPRGAVESGQSQKAGLPGRNAETVPGSAENGAKGKSSAAGPAPPKVKADKPKAPPAPAPRADGRAQVYGLDFFDDGAYTTVVAYVDKVTPYVYNLIPPSRNGGAFRVYADLKNAVIAPRAKTQLPQSNNLVKLVKINQFQDDVVRVVMDMPEAHSYRPTFLDQPSRLVFQVAKSAADLPSQAVEAQPEPPQEDKGRAGPPTKGQSSAAGKQVKGPDESIIRHLGLKVKTVVIDPGHGGKDLGTSKNGLSEKDIALTLSKKLAEKIEKRLGPGLKVILTRNDDRFITLERRTKIAEDNRGDLFISLHVNANALAEVEGFETYVLNFATDRSAMAVAARENAESDKSVADLRDLLQIIANNTKIAESRAMAQVLHKSALANINAKYKVRDLGVKEAPFWVLVNTRVPSILVEIGFITNDNDAARLSKDDYLESVAEGLALGLENYVKGF